MRISLATLFISILILGCQSNLSTEKKRTNLCVNPTDFFESRIGERPKILALGTFHFDYPGLDFHKIDDNKKIDILSLERQTELKELLGYIKRFKPTKIGIEATDDWGATERLKKYSKGEIALKRSERYQIGIRLASELNLDTIYSLDASHFAQDLYKRDSIFSNELWKDFDWNGDDPIGKYYNEWSSLNDSLIFEKPLLDYFKYLNSKEVHSCNYGSYLIGGFKLDDHRGADILSTFWYNRNLRIFRKIQQLDLQPSDRLLIIFGNAHVAVLRQLIECSPEFEFIEFDNLK
tara:strand:- start:12940 stop:13815 length:876 start_codon:yes stop_codon:yes gene_type:complete